MFVYTIHRRDYTLEKSENLGVYAHERLWNGYGVKEAHAMPGDLSSIMTLMLRL